MAIINLWNKVKVSADKIVEIIAPKVSTTGLGNQQRIFSYYWMLLLIEIHRRGWVVQIGEMERNSVAQQLMFEAGKSKVKGDGTGFHERRLAGDLARVETAPGIAATSSQMKELGDFWEGLDKLNSWGGYFTSIKDEPHFSYGGERRR